MANPSEIASGHSTKKMFRKSVVCFPCLLKESGFSTVWKAGSRPWRTQVGGSRDVVRGEGAFWKPCEGRTEGGRAKGAVGVGFGVGSSGL